MLILGATAGLRNLASGHFEEIYVSDFSLPMFRGESRRVISEALRKEAFVEEDWLNLGSHFAENFFDCVAGDIVTRQIAPEKLNMFFGIMRRLLRPGGLFITRTYHQNSSWKHIALRDILANDFEIFKGGWRGIVYQTRLRIYDKYIPFLESLFGLAKAASEILATKDKFRNSDAEEFIRSVFGSDLVILGSKFTHMLESDFEKIAINHFKVVSKLYSPHSPDFEFYPIYVLTNV